MRKSRVRKFRNKKKPFITTWKVFSIIYLTLFGLNNLSSSTNAIYIAEVQNQSTFHASWTPKPNEEWDRSSLKFWKEDEEKDKSTNQKQETLNDHYGFNCIDGIFSDIENTGENMKGTSIYMVRYSDTPQINKNIPGEIVYEGEIPAILSSEIERLVYKPEAIQDLRPGYYKMSALQRPYHPGGVQNESKEYKGRFEIWGESTIHVTGDLIAKCVDSKQPAAESKSEPAKAADNEINANDGDSSKTNQLKNDATQNNENAIVPEVTDSNVSKEGGETK